MQYKNTSKGAADERLTWSIRPDLPFTVVTKKKKKKKTEQTTAFRVPATL
jgi:hypothetical protein